MSTYRYSYCPYCHKMINFDRSEFYFYERYIDLEYRRCPKCNRIYKTDKKLYHQMNPKEKNNIRNMYYINIFATSATIFALLFLFAVLLISVFFQDNIGEFVTKSIIIISIISLVLGYILAKSNYEQIKSITINDFDIDDELKDLLRKENNMRYKYGYFN